ncbi:MAG TPA: helix-turn-helix transcriptional regulator [Acidimicrobiales bacterium]|nr:helix-turn-helix transcriptional regulator [Acidimicrobiales bacterium]
MVGRPVPDDARQFLTAQGALLRAARARQALTLQGVEAITGGEFKAASLSAYERGERMISVLRLLRLASLYGSSLDELVPGSPAEPAPAGRPRPVASPAAPTIRIDVARLERRRGAGWDQLRTYVRTVQARRRGRHARVVVLRGEDAWAVAAMLAVEVDELVGFLEGAGVAPSG